MIGKKYKNNLKIEIFIFYSKLEDIFIQNMYEIILIYVSIIILKLEFKFKKHDDSAISHGSLIKWYL